MMLHIGGMYGIRMICMSDVVDAALTSKNTNWKRNNLDEPFLCISVSFSLVSPTSYLCLGRNITNLMISTVSTFSRNHTKFTSESTLTAVVGMYTPALTNIYP